jgi:hypothetical protein
VDIELLPSGASQPVDALDAPHRQLQRDEQSQCQMADPAREI